MKLSLKALFIVSLIGIIIVFSSAALLLKYQNKRVQSQISLVEKTLKESFYQRGSLSYEQNLAILNSIKQRLGSGAQRNLKMVLILLFFSIFVTTGITYVLFLRVTRKLEKMLKVTRSIESGSYGPLLDINTNDELQHLAEAINHMAVAIKEREQELSLNNAELLIEIEERKRSEAQLQEQKSYLKKLIDTVKAGIVLIDAENHTIVDANAAIAAMIGCQIEDMLGQHCWGFFCPAEKDHCPITFKNENLNNTEKTLVKVSGEIIPVLKTANYLHINGKKHIIESMLDLTELKKAEQLLLKNFLLLLSFFQEQLLQSQKMESIGKLVGGIAHDFNNMLSGVIGFNHLAIKNSSPDSPVYKYLSQVDDAAKRAANVTRQLLLFSRKDPIDKEMIGVNDLIELMSGLLTNLLGEKLHIDFDLEPGIPPVLGNSGQLEQVVMNLAINARDAMPNGGTLKIQTRLVVHTHDTVSDHDDIPLGSFVNIIVTDTGVGISEDIIGNIFIPFFTTKPKEQGTGLGLSTVYGIIRQHESHIFVKSSPGVGTTFSILIPVATKEEKPQTRSMESLPTIQGDAAIYVVEDELILRELAQATLSPLGFTVSVFSDAETCIKTIQKNGFLPDILITDVVLPGLSGIDLLNRLEPLNHEMKIVIMTGYSDNKEQIDEKVEKGALFIEKPLTPDKLIRTIDSCLDSSLLDDILNGSK